jgi:hypothetical protein
MPTLNTRHKALGLILMLLAIIFVISTLKNQDKKRSKTASTHEQELEQIHSLGYDQGYVSAVIDAYLGDPQYMLTEEHGGDFKLWKRTNIDPDHTKKLEQEKYE